MSTTPEGTLPSDVEVNALQEQLEELTAEQIAEQQRQAAVAQASWQARDEAYRKLKTENPDEVAARRARIYQMLQEYPLNLAA